MTTRVLLVWWLLGCMGAAIEVWTIFAGRNRGMTPEMARARPDVVCLGAMLAILSGPISLGILAGGMRRERTRQAERDRLERSFERAKARMLGCQHARTVKVDYGMGPVTDKCVRCWAFRLPDGRWTPSSAPPPETP